METIKKQFARMVIGNVGIFMPARIIFAEPGKAPETGSAAPAEGAEGGKVEGDNGGEKKDPDKHEADKAAAKAEAEGKIDKLKKDPNLPKPGDRPKPSVESAESDEKPAVSEAKNTPAKAPETSSSAAQSAPAPKADTAPKSTPAEVEQRTKFEGSFLGQLARTFGGSTKEEQDKAADEAFHGKGLIGALVTVLGYGAFSSMVDKVADKSPQAKGFLDRIKGWFSGLMGNDEVEKATAFGFTEACKTAGILKKEYELVEDVIIPDKTEILFSQLANENELGSITIPSGVSDVKILVSKGGVDEERILKAGDTYDRKKVGTDFRIASGTVLSKGVKLSRYCSVVIDKGPEKPVA